MHSDSKQMQDVERFFTDFAANWSTLYGGQRSFFWRWVDQRFRWAIYERYRLTFCALGENLSGKKILDVGCGNGVYAFEALRRGAGLVVGVDVAPGMIELCRARSGELGLNDRTRFVCSAFPPTAPVAELKQKFDVGIVMGVLDYISDPVPFLEALRDRVSECAVISFPAKDPLRWPLRRWRYRLLGRCAVFHYHESEVRDALARAGFSRFEVTHIACTGSSYFVRAWG